MTDEKHEVRQINWHEVFSFPQIFKGFRMAIHRSKLLLALAAIVAVFIAGWVLDGIWGLCEATAFTAYTPQTGIGGRNDEIVEHFALSDADFDRVREQWRRDRPLAAADLMFKQQEESLTLASFRGDLNEEGFASTYLRDAFVVEELDDRDAEDVADVAKDKQEADAEPAKVRREGYEPYLHKAEEALDSEIKRIRKLMPDAVERAKKAIEDADLEDAQTEQALEDLELAQAQVRHLIAQRRSEFAAAKRQIKGRGIFESFTAYQEACIMKGIRAVCYGNFFGGLADYQRTVEARSLPRRMGQAGPPLADRSPAPPDDAAQPGFFYWVLMGLNGWCWLVTEHWLFAIVFLAVLLAVWSLFGGAIHRIAALHAARDEKMSMMQGLRFAIGKFPSFFTAPLIPVAIILVLGGLLAFGGLIFGTYAGGIVMSVLFGLALLLGLGVAFLLIGLTAGGWLMYPTIAAEGSDSFDAISRSFSYVFARPFRAAFYGLVALVYGVITYLFVRFFAYVLLAGVHVFVGWGVFASGDAVSPHADKLDVIWSAPTFDDLWGSFNWAAMSGPEKVGAFILGIWVFLVAAAVGAYLLSYFASSMTTIYLLLRQKVDATDLDDVYVEEAEEEPLPPAEPEEAPAEPAGGEGGAEGAQGAEGQGEGPQAGGEGEQGSEPIEGSDEPTT